MNFKLISVMAAFLPVLPLGASAHMGSHQTLQMQTDELSRSGPAIVVAGRDTGDKGESGALIKGDRTIDAVVKNVQGEQIEVDTGDGQSRFLNLKEAKEKGFPDVKAGDKLQIVVNEQNLVVDFHPLHQDQAQHHQKIKGQIAQSLVVGHEKAVIRSENGREETYAIRPLARSKMSSMPVGSSAVFLVDETNQIVDVTFENESATENNASAKKSPPKGAHVRVEGTIVEPLQANTIRIKTANGEERPYEVRPMIGKKLEGMTRGQFVILMIDTEGNVIDVAIPKAKGGKG